MSWLWSQAHRPGWAKSGCSSIWLTAGHTPVSSTSRWICTGVKLDTPIARTRPWLADLLAQLGVSRAVQGVGAAVALPAAQLIVTSTQRRRR
jgi:hypothetical protein